MKNNKLQASSLLLAAMITFLSPTASLAAPASEAWTKESGSYQMIDGTSINGVVARGIDVSHWKQNIDWNAVAADDVQFVMLGTRYNGEIDPYFRINADGAAKAGISIGAYLYSYALTPEMASAEADFVLDLIKDYPISYPVAFDIEDSSQGHFSPAELAAIIQAFCSKIEAAGYHPMVYANDYWLANKLDISQLPYDIWVARYEQKHTFENPVMWQATNTGSINGIAGNVDINFQYKDLSGVIPANRFRTIADKTYYYKNYQMQKNSWINDGSDWFFMNQDGLTSKGWMTTADGSYYLDEASGKMATGFRQLNSSWYYFADSGLMSKGWVTDNDTRYFMKDDGSLQTGWLDHNNTKYYLGADGSLSTGWRQIDNAWYYFVPTTGEITTGWLETDGAWYYLNPNGMMATDQIVTVDGIKYQADSNGVCTPVPEETATTNDDAVTEGSGPHTN